MGKNASRFRVALLIALLLALALAPAPPPAGVAGEAENKLDGAWWARTAPFVRRALNLPRSLQVNLQQTIPVSGSEFHLVVLEIRRGEQVRPVLFYASTDGSKVVVENQVYDLTQKDPFAANRERIQLERAPSQGPAAAPVTIVEYSDYTCPWCQRFFLTLEKPLRERYGDRVRYIYKQFPLVGVRAWSEDAAVAAACAFRQSNEAFWALHDQLFLHLAELKDKQIFLQLARQLSFDTKEFQTCVERRESLPDVQRDVAEAKSLGVDGTPTFFINGRPLYGLPSSERFFEIVEEELALTNVPAKN